MEPKSQPSGNSPPPKPWERAPSSSGPAPFRPPSAGNTSDVVEASGTAKPGEIVSNSDNTCLIYVLRILFDRSGVLYGELARFVLGLLGIRAIPKKINPPGPNGLPLPAPHNSYVGNYIEGTQAAPSGPWDNLWENDTNKR